MKTCKVLLRDGNWYTAQYQGKTPAIDYDGDRHNAQLLETITITDAEDGNKTTYPENFIFMECHRDCIKL